MGRYEDSLARLIKQERCIGYPEATAEEILTITAGAYMYNRGYDTPNGDEKTIEDLERKKENGYGALINDGKLIGFIYEKTP